MIGSGLINDCMMLTKHFGLIQALRIRVFPMIWSKVSNKSYARTRNEGIIRLLSYNLRDIISSYSQYGNDIISYAISASSPIWVCWWQGEAKMPPVVAQCYKILKRNLNGHPLNLVTSENFTEFVDLPEIILRKVREGKISITHLSDILRVSLLAKHGGLWIDSTYWCTCPLNIDGNIFYTLKQEEVETGLVSRFRWMGACIGGSNDFYLFRFLRDCLYSYWDRYDCLIDYFLLDYLLEIAFRNYNNIANIVENGPYRCPDLHIMKKIFNHRYNKEYVDKLENENCMFKLSWKESYNSTTEDGSKTIYGYFMSL